MYPYSSARRTAKLFACAAAVWLMSQVPCYAATQPPYTWANQPPTSTPFEKSTSFSNVRFTGRYANYSGADTWYPSWGADDALYSPFADGFGPGGLAIYFFNTTGWSRITGSDPLALSLSGGLLYNQTAGPYGGRYPSASLHHNGVWYYGSYVLDQEDQPASGCGNWCQQGPFVGFDYSTNNGTSWTRTSRTPANPLFGESGKNGGRVRLGPLHFVDFGRNMEHSPDGYAYLVSHGTQTPGNHNSWIQGDHVYLIRVIPTPANINDRAAYQYYAGTVNGTPVWSSNLGDMQPLLTWLPAKIGNVSVIYNAPLGRYFMFMARPRNGIQGTGRYDAMILESPSLTGPWRLVHYLPEYGTQAYFVTAPTKFISPDGRTMWLVYSANYAGGHPSIPTGSQYNLSIHELVLESGTPPKLEAEHAVLNGGATVSTAWPGYSGPGYVTGYQNPGARTAFEIPMDAAGTRTFRLRYANGPDGGAITKHLSIFVDGVLVKRTALPYTGGWTSWAEQAETLDLTAGVHSVEYRRDAGDEGFVNLDAVTVAVACNDGVDNDGDGATDFPSDIGCRDAAWDTENPACDDGVDNDGDGRIDWDGGPGGGTPDPQCSPGPFTKRESPSTACGLGAELVLLLPLLAVAGGPARSRRPGTAAEPARDRRRARHPYSARPGAA